LPEGADEARSCTEIRRLRPSHNRSNEACRNRNTDFDGLIHGHSVYLLSCGATVLASYFLAQK
jgi:hypothetical protein